MPSSKGIGSYHKSGTGENQGTQRTSTRDNWCFNCNYCHSKSNNLSLPMIYVSSPLNNSVINPSQLSSVCQQLSSSLHNTPRDKRCFNSKGSISKSNELLSPVIPAPTPLNYSVIIGLARRSEVRRASPMPTHRTYWWLRAYVWRDSNSAGQSSC